jgi:hypothetical protein
MIHQAKPNPQLLDEQIFSERLHPRFLLLADTVAKVVLPKVSKIVRAAGAVFV